MKLALVTWLLSSVCVENARMDIALHLGAKDCERGQPDCHAQVDAKLRESLTRPSFISRKRTYRPHMNKLPDYTPSGHAPYRSIWNDFAPAMFNLKMPDSSFVEVDSSLSNSPHMPDIEGEENPQSKKVEYERHVEKWYLTIVVVFLIVVFTSMACGKFCGMWNCVMVKESYGGNIYYKIFRLFLNTVWLMPLHVARCFSDAEMLHGNLMSREELKMVNNRRKPDKQYVLYKEDGTFEEMNKRLVPNLLAYRRSYIYASIFFCVFTSFLQFMDFLDLLEMYSYYKDWAQSSQKPDFKEYKRLHGYPVESTHTEDITAWFEFTKFTFRGMSSALSVQTWVIDAAQAGLQLMFNLCAIGVYLRAGHFWIDFKRSTKIARWGFILLVVPPLLITAFPTRLFVDFGVLDPMAAAYSVELDKYTQNQAEQWTVEALERCKQVSTMREENQIQGAIDSVQGVCAKIRRYTPNEHIKCCAVYELIDAPFDQMHTGCNDFDTHVKSGTFDNLQDFVKFTEDKICAVFKNDINKPSSGFKTDITGIIDNNKKEAESHLEFFTQNSLLSSTLKSTVEYGICLLRALRNFNAIFSVAMVIGPALFYGAFKLKMIVPMSDIPSYLLMLYPWIYCPFSWCLNNFVFQLIGDNELATILFPALLMMSFSPFVYIFYGTCIVKVLEPLTDAEMDSFSYQAWGIEIVTKLCGYILFGIYFYKAWQKNTDRPQWDSFIIWLEEVAGVDSSYFAQLVINALADYFVCDLTGSDFLWIHVATVRKNELMFRYFENEEEREQPSSGGPDASPLSPGGVPVSAIPFGTEGHQPSVPESEEDKVLQDKRGHDIRDLTMERARRLDALVDGLYGDNFVDVSVETATAERANARRVPTSASPASLAQNQGHPGSLVPSQPGQHHQMPHGAMAREMQGVGSQFGAAGSSQMGGQPPPPHWGPANQYQQQPPQQQGWGPGTRRQSLWSRNQAYQQQSMYYM